jgi:hypothetical protein
MAKSGFHVRAEFAEREVILADLKQRVVSEAVRAG